MPGADGDIRAAPMFATRIAIVALGRETMKMPPRKALIAITSAHAPPLSRGRQVDLDRGPLPLSKEKA